MPEGALVRQRVVQPRRCDADGRGDTRLQRLSPELAKVAGEGMPGVDAIVLLEITEMRELQWALVHHE